MIQLRRNVNEKPGVIYRDTLRNPVSAVSNSDTAEMIEIFYVIGKLERTMPLDFLLSIGSRSSIF